MEQTIIGQTYMCFIIYVCIEMVFAYTVNYFNNDIIYGQVFKVSLFKKFIVL